MNRTPDTVMVEATLVFVSTSWQQTWVGLNHERNAANHAAALAKVGVTANVTPVWVERGVRRA